MNLLFFILAPTHDGFPQLFTKRKQVLRKVWFKMIIEVVQHALYPVE